MGGRPRTIFHIAGGWWPMLGGGELLATRVSEGLARRGHRVQVLVASSVDDSQPPAWPDEYPPFPGIEMEPLPEAVAAWTRRLGILRRWRVPGRGEMRQAFRRLRHRAFRRAADGLARIHDPDAILVSCNRERFLKTFTGRPPWSRFPVLAVTQAHLEDPVWPHEAARRAWTSVDALAVNTAHEAGELASRYGVDPAACSVTGCGTDVPPSPAPWPRPPRVLYLGRVHPGKGIGLLLAALRRVWARRPDARLVIAGARTNATPEVDGWIDALEPSERARVERPRDLREPEKARLLSSSACLVSPSVHESFGIVLLEALAHGTPVVALDGGVTRCVLTHGTTGLLVPRDDAEALAAAILDLLDQPAVAQRIGAAGRREVERHHTWDHVAGRYEDALESAIARFSSRRAARSGPGRPTA